MYQFIITMIDGHTETKTIYEDTRSKAWLVFMEWLYKQKKQYRENIDTITIDK